jgi:hypothetical protein
LPGGGGTDSGSLGDLGILFSLIKECPPVGGHSPWLKVGLFVLLLMLSGLLTRLLVGLLVLALLLLALLALPLLLLTVLLRLLRVAVLGVVHR